MAAKVRASIVGDCVFSYLFSPILFIHGVLLPLCTCSTLHTHASCSLLVIIQFAIFPFLVPQPPYLALDGKIWKSADLRSRGLVFEESEGMQLLDLISHLASCTNFLCP